MFRRSILILIVVGFIGTVALGIGILYAPAPGHQTRERLAADFQEYQETLTDLLVLSRKAFGDAVAVVSGSNLRGDDS